MEISPDLLQACLDKKQAAVHQLYKSCFSKLMQIAMRYARDKEEATELLNLAFVRIIYQLPKYNNSLPFPQWMHRVAVNVIIDRFRSEKRYRSLQLQAEDYSQLEQEEPRTNSIEDEIGYNYLLELIRSLPPMTAHVFNLYAVDGFKHREIGEILGISENTSKWHVNQARNLLQAMLSETKTYRNA